jgi:hypothetical protein
MLKERDPILREGKVVDSVASVANQVTLLRPVTGNMVFLPIMVMENSIPMQILCKLKILMIVAKDLVR